MIIYPLVFHDQKDGDFWQEKDLSSRDRKNKAKIRFIVDSKTGLNLYL